MSNTNEHACEVPPSQQIHITQADPAQPLKADDNTDSNEPKKHLPPLFTITTPLKSICPGENLGRKLQKQMIKW